MVLLYTLAFLLPAVYRGVYASIGPSAELEIVNRDIAPDGFTRPATLAGGTFPGPIIRGKKGDTFSIDVTDKLEDRSMDLATSIHWHGIFQRHTNYVDGVASVTQCPLVPNESFLYKFNVSDQTGTFWYHSHFRNQYCDGLRGALIIEDPADPQRHLYDVDDDTTVITLADWYHYLSTNPAPIPAFSSTLINGKGRYPGGPSNVSLAVVNVQRGLRYRFRLVSVSCDPSFIFSIDGHQMTVIEVEGNNVQPLLIDSLEIFTAQRYSVVVKADRPVGNYRIRSLPNVPGRNFSDFNNLAILRYAGASHANPTDDPTVNVPVSKLPLVETHLHPLTDSPAPGNPVPGGADININLNVSVNAVRTNFLINGFAFDFPTVPILLQILSGAKKASDLVPAGSIYGLQPNKSVELTIPGGALGGPVSTRMSAIAGPSPFFFSDCADHRKHPVHLHGHAFSVVRSAGNSSYNFANPVIRDVVSIGNTGDNVTIRFFTDNPGPWFFHCHIDWHLTVGFAVVFAEDVPDVPTQDITTGEFVSISVRRPILKIRCLDAWRDLCPVYDRFVNTTDT
ncbi:laccase [Lactarius pseudohatsudake]|nr:laccase [Lactarius pseudohatsudake]